MALITHLIEADGAHGGLLPVWRWAQDRPERLVPALLACYRRRHRRRCCGPCSLHHRLQRATLPVGLEDPMVVSLPLHTHRLAVVRRQERRLGCGRLVEGEARASELRVQLLHRLPIRRRLRRRAPSPAARGRRALAGVSQGGIELQPHKASRTSPPSLHPVVQLPHSPRCRRGR